MRIVLAFAAALASGACSSPDDASGDFHLELVQAPTVVTPGTVTPQSVLVRVVNEDGTSIPGVPVTWSIRSGGGRLTPSADTSGVDGLAAAQWTPGLLAGSQAIGASIYDQPALKITIAADAFHADRIDAGAGGVCGLQGTATWCWVDGRNSNQTFRILSQVQAKTLALSDGNACVVDLGGVTYCYRYDRYNGSSDPDAYQSVTGLPAINAISSGDTYFCGLAVADGTPWCWGSTFFDANQLSTTLRLTSIAAGNNVGCGLAEDGAAWCWDSFEAPTLVPGGHTFRQISVGQFTACAIEAPARLFCWDPTGQAPVPMAGASPATIAMGFYTNLMNVQSGVMSFTADPSAAQITFNNLATFPFPAAQISGDDTPCLVALDGAVYCLGIHDNTHSIAYPYTWEAIPAPQP